MTEVSIWIIISAFVIGACNQADDADSNASRDTKDTSRSRDVSDLSTNDGHSPSDGEVETAQAVTNYPETTEPTWVRVFGGEEANVINGAAMIPVREVYFVGQTKGPVAGEQAFGGGYDILRATYSENGRQTSVGIGGGTASSELARSVEFTGSKLYIAGHGSAGFDDGRYNGGPSDANVVANQDGQTVWHALIGTPGTDYLAEMDVNEFGRSAYVGNTNNSFANHQNSGSTDGYVAVLDRAGNQQWVDQIGTEGRDGINDCLVTDSGEVYVVGTVASQLTGQEAEGSGSDGFIRKYEANGEIAWTKMISGEGDEGASSITRSNGYLYVVGTMTEEFGGMPYAGGELDGFVGKYTFKGERRNIKPIASEGTETLTKVTHDFDGNIYIVGYTQGGIGNYEPEGNSDILVAKFTEDLEWESLVQFGGEGYDRARTLVSSEDGKVFIGGHTNAALMGQSHSGERDALIARIW